MLQRIAFRADGNQKLGLGHLIRSLSLLEILRDDFACIFITNRESDPETKKLIRGHCELVELDTKDVKDEARILASYLERNDILVLDGYDFDGPYQRTIKSIVSKLVVIDDMAKGHFFADLIINHGNKGFATAYESEPYSKVLAGFDFLLLRKAFLKQAPFKRVVSRVESCFICFGGADTYNITCKSLQACIDSDFLKKIVIVTGSAYRHADVLEKSIQFNKKRKLILHESNVGEERLIFLIQSADTAIAPSSSIALEICCVKTGLLTGIFVDNQQAIHDQLVDSGCALSVGNFTKVTVEEIAQGIQKMNNPVAINTLMKSQLNSIDGKSGERLRKEFVQL